MGSELTWGRRYLMVAPDHFRVDYAINPFMDLASQPDPARTRAEWESIVAAILVGGAWWVFTLVDFDMAKLAAYFGFTAAP